MAGTLTHIKFGHDLYNRLNLKNIDKDFFVIGNQGHDLNFFIHLWEYPLKKKIFKLTKDLQQVDINKFKNLVKGTSNETRSFLYGYLAHEILDRKVHPYINYKSNDNHDKHALLESIIDVKLNDMNTIKKKIPKHLKITKQFKRKIISIFKTYFKSDKYGKRITRSINNVYPFLRLYRFDKLGIKKIMYSLISKKKLRFLSFNYNSKELDVEMDEFIKLYNEALYQAETFLRILDKKGK